LTGGDRSVYEQDMRATNPAQGDFEELQASVLYCNRCAGPRPVRDRLLLVLPDGELREYLCGVCGTSVGSRRVSADKPLILAT
jgi:hypothetical protein